MIGTFVMVFVLLFLTVGLVVSVRFVLKRVRHSVLSANESGPLADSDGPVERAQFFDTEEDELGGDGRPLTGRELKERYLRGEISKDEFDRRLRALQLDDYLKGRQ